MIASAMFVCTLLFPGKAHPTMFSNVPIVVLSSVAILWCLRYLLRRAARNGDLPSLPRSRLFGHLPTITKYMNPDRHPGMLESGYRPACPLTRSIDYGFNQIYHELGEPDWFYYDPLPLPFSPGVIVVTSPAIAEQITQPSTTLPYSSRKSWTLGDVQPLVGATSLITSYVWSRPEA